MSTRMQRLSVKKEQRKQRRQAQPGDEYEPSESDVSSNIDRNSSRRDGGKSKQSQREEQKQFEADEKSSQSSNYQADVNASTQAQTKYNKSPNKNAQPSNFEEMEGDQEQQMEEEIVSVNLDDVEPEEIQVTGKINANVARKVRRRRSIVEQTHDLRVLLNRIFQMRGGWVIKNIAQDFSDGFLFQELFNILYDEKVDCCLEGVKSEPNKNIPLDQKTGNWNKINAGICFNYFQQQFYFVQGTMQTLAKGKNNELTAQAIRELLIAMQGTHHNTFDDATDVRDIADLLRINI